MATNTGEIIISSRPDWQIIGHDSFNVQDGSIRFDSGTGKMFCARDSVELIHDLISGIDTCPSCALTVIHEIVE